MNTPPFVAITLKRTHHVLGLLSRDADAAGGSDIKLLAPETFPVRAPRRFVPSAAIPPEFELRVPQAYLAAVSINTADPLERRQVFSRPMDCAVDGGGEAAPFPAAAATPVFAFGAVAAGAVSTFNVTNTLLAGSSGIAFSVFIEEVAPPAGNAPITSVTEGSVASGLTNASAVTITKSPDPASPTPVSLPTGRKYRVIVAVAGMPLLIETKTL